MTEHERSIDPAIIEAVHSVTYRFGAPGLEDLIAEAQRELAEARAALEQLRNDSA